LTSRPETLRVTASHRFDETSQTAREQAEAQAVQKAEHLARQTAAALGQHLLGLAHSEQKIVQSEAGQSAEARIEAEYFVSKFQQVKLDLKLLANSGNLSHLIKKELSMRLFQFQMERRSQPDLHGQSASRRALVTGHFSIPGGGGTFGDVEALGVVCQWLAEAGIEFEAASNHEDGVDGPLLAKVDPLDYGLFIFVCGPWYPRKKIPAALLRQFAHCLKIGVNLTTYEAGNAGFDFLLARDNPEEHRADLAFARQQESLPVVGILLVERQAAYGNKQRHLYVRQVFNDYLATGRVVPIWLDTVIHGNRVGLHSGQAFESLLRKVDVLLTNRLHGLVLGLKNKVPVVAVDAVAGGGKVTAQAKSLGWPVLLPVEALSLETLEQAVQTCLKPELRAALEQTHQQGAASIARTHSEFFEILKKFNN